MGRRLTIGAAPGGGTIPYGTTAQRPDSAGAGFLRFNTDRNFLEFYNGSAWLPVGTFQTVSTATNVTATAGQAIFLDTSSGGRTITLPASPELVILLECLMLQEHLTQMLVLLDVTVKELWVILPT